MIAIETYIFMSFFFQKPINTISHYVGGSKYSLMFILALCILASCTYRPKEKRLTKFQTDNSEIIRSFYKKTADTIEFRRVVSDGASLKLQCGQIFTGDYALVNQRFTIVQLLNGKVIPDSLITKLKDDDFHDKLFDDRDVMFIQIVPDSSMGNFEALGFLNLRQDVEGRIDARLKKDNLGEWFAGDMGAGGNMLFFVDDWEPSLKAALDVLRTENLLEHVIIAKRLMITKEDWSYEIIFPIEYQGVFNEM